MKTKGMKQQLEALRRMENREFYALFMEQGTGKTWTLLADAERLYMAGKIDGLLVVAPKGVHTNWVRREVPAHMEGSIIARAWRSGAGKRELAHVNELLRPRELGEPVPLRILTINIDAVNTKDGFAFCVKFLRATKAMMVVDESSRIKNPDAVRTKQLLRLRPLAAYARIATGTPMPNGPLGLFSQMEFLEPGLLGTTSYRAFVAEYAELMDPSSPQMRRMIEKNPRVKHAQLVAKDEAGRPIWRNLEKLQSKLEPHTYRVLKKDCLELPPKVYTNVYFDMTPKQWDAYRYLRDELRIALEEPSDEELSVKELARMVKDGDPLLDSMALAQTAATGGKVLTVKALAALVKLQQITSGFVLLPDGKVHYIEEDNPRLKALENWLEDNDSPIILWARFNEELNAVTRLLRRMGRRAVEYRGSTSTADRELAVDSFQGGDADAFVGQPQAGGIGLTLTRAELVAYFSNDFNLETRLQSEDRAHRIGLAHTVLYADFMAEGTIDEAIARAHQNKIAISAAVLGDSR